MFSSGRIAMCCPYHVSVRTVIPGSSKAFVVHRNGEGETVGSECKQCHQILPPSVFIFPPTNYRPGHLPQHEIQTTRPQHVYLSKDNQLCAQVKRHFEEQQRKALEEQKNERERLRLLQLEEEAKAKAKAEKERQDKADADKKMQDMLAEQQRATAMQAQMQAQMQAKMQVRVCLFMREKKVEYCCNGKYTMTVKSQFNLHCLYGWLQQQMHGCMNE